MNDDRQLRDSLTSAADPVGEVDLVDSAWRRGRSSRARQRLTWTGIGGALTAAAVLALGQGWTGDVQPATHGNHDDVESTSARDTVQEGPPGPGDTVSATFTKAPGAEGGGALASPAADPTPIQGSLWRLARLHSSQEGTLSGAIGTELRFDGTTWWVTACGLQSHADGHLALGRIRITGTWQQANDQAAADCSTDSFTTQQWQSLLNSSPEVGFNDTTLVLHGWGGPDETQQDTDVAIAFAPRGVEPALGQPTKLPDATILEQEWQEVPAEEAATLFDPLLGTRGLDIAPHQQLSISAEAGTLSVVTCGTWTIQHTWVNDFESVNNGVAGLLVAAGEATPSKPHCPGAAGMEGEALESILRSHPEVYLFGDYLIIRGLAPKDLLDPDTG